MIGGRGMAALSVFVAVYIGVYLRNKRRRFVYSSYGIKDNEVLRALELAKAEDTQRALFLLPNWMHSVLRGRLQKLMDLVAIFLGGVQLVREGKRHVIKHILYPGNNCALNVQYNPAKGTSFLDFFYPRNKTSTRVIVFIHGGAWGSGSKFLYRLFGMNLANLLGVTVANVGYGTYPTQGAQGQIDDVSTAVHFVSSNASRFGVDAEEIFLMGHSSGAHIATMAVLQQPSIRRKLKALFPLSGVYDLNAHYLYECARGVENISTLKPACGASEESYRRLSPQWTVQDDAFKATLTEPIPPIYLVHGLRDGVVPHTSSGYFHEALIQQGISASFERLEEVDHASIILDIIGIDPTQTVLPTEESMPVLVAHLRKTMKGEN